jgi:hypothetical protein
MSALNVFPIGTLTITDSMRATLRALSASSVPDAPFAALVGALCKTAAEGSGAGASARSGSSTIAGRNGSLVAFAAHPALARLATPATAQGAAELLAALLTDYARAGAPPSAVRAALEDGGLSASKAAAFVDAFAPAAERIRATLVASGASLCGGRDLRRGVVGGSSS